MNRPGWNPDAVRRFLEASAILDAYWYAARYGLGQAGPEECIRDYLEQGAARGRVPNARFETLEQGAGDPLAFAGATQSSASADISALRNLVQAAGAFDSDLYLEANPDVRAARINPLRHFLEYGWKELRNPSAGFDVWWYWSNWLDPRSELVNPLLHYLVSGAARGLQTTPSRPAGWSEGARLSPGSRRICLFAGYDPDGVVDDYVVRYVRELSRHADVYYLADCAMAAGELERLGPWVKGAWAERHGTYDFGSWSRLARELVGWDVIDGYDELLLANDSCYPVRPLDQVFAKMDATPCDWWGLQLTKRSFTEENSGDSPFPTVDQAVTGPLGDHTHALLDSLHVSSYFVAFRRPVASDPGFRRCIEAVVAQDRKLSIVTKYEIGTCQYLLSCGFRLSTFVDHLYPFHPAYTARVFDLIGDGFPLFKRFMLTDNTRNVANLAQWKERILAVAPDAPVEEMERNLLRVADADKLERSFSISEGPDGKPLVPKLLSASEMAQADARTPKFDHWWAFPVCAFDHLLTGNERAVFEQVRDDPSIRKIVLTRKRRIRLEGENVVVCPLESPQGQYCLLRAKQIFVKHSPSINARYPLSAKLHNFINLWHGIPLKRFGPASLDMQDHLEQVYRENRACRAVISSSKVDALAMSAAFYPLPYRDVWITGLPRNDFIACPEERLPADFREEGLRLEAELAGRRLVLFAPTFKNAQADGYYRFGEEEIAWLRGWQEANDAVLGVREHMADRAHSYYGQLARLGALDLSSTRYPNIEVLYRQSAMLITDYSSCAIDFMLTGRPAISFAYDFEHYAGTERGLFYDLDHVFPGPVCRDFATLKAAMGLAMAGDAGSARAWRNRFFFDHPDDASAWRVVERVRRLYVAEGTGTASGTVQRKEAA